jgi:hypothetical protein
MSGRASNFSSRGEIKPIEEQLGQISAIYSFASLRGKSKGSIEYPLKYF